MAFEGLTGKLSAVFKKLKSKGKLSESDVKACMREVKLALLEADVNYKVVKDFVAKVSERAVGAEVLNSLTPAQQVIKIVNEELCALMGTTGSRIVFPSKPPCIVMMCGRINNTSLRSQLAVAKDLFRQTCFVDMSDIDGQKRNPRWAEAILRSYARNLCTLAETKTIYRDVRATTELSESTFYDYLEALEKLYIVEDVLAWCPAIRSKTAIRASRKRNMVDPSVAVAALGLSPAYFNEDFKTLGFLFESLCMRDLKAYSSALGGELSYYRDRYGLEADAVLHLDDGRYALVEFKLGESEIDEGAKHLLEIERLVSERNKKEEQVPLRLPDVKLVITATEYGYRREDGVCVVPIGCLRP